MAEKKTHNEAPSSSNAEEHITFFVIGGRPEKMPTPGDKKSRSSAMNVDKRRDSYEPIVPSGDQYLRHLFPFVSKNKTPTKQQNSSARRRKADIDGEYLPKGSHHRAKKRKRGDGSSSSHKDSSSERLLICDKCGCKTSKSNNSFVDAKIWPLHGDYSYKYSCKECTNGRGKFETGQKGWPEIVKLVLYNLQRTCPKRKISFQNEIIPFIDEHWRAISDSALPTGWHEEVLYALRHSNEISHARVDTDKWKLNHFDDFKRRLHTEKKRKESRRSDSPKSKTPRLSRDRSASSSAAAKKKSSMKHSDTMIYGNDSATYSSHKASKKKSDTGVLKPPSREMERSCSVQVMLNPSMSNAHTVFSFPGEVFVPVAGFHSVDFDSGSMTSGASFSADCPSDDECGLVVWPRGKSAFRCVKGADFMPGTKPLN